MTERFDAGEWATTPQERLALDQLFASTYQELRRLASSVRRDDPNATLNPTALVNEAWLKLSRWPGFEAASRLHFKRIAARAMRQVLIEMARRRKARKRGSGAGFVTLDESLHATVLGGYDLTAPDQALTDLGRIHPRQAQMVESRFFGGLDITETATLLDVSEATIRRDWRAAKAWLAHEVRRGR